MSKLNRRDFLKVLGTTGLAGCEVLDKFGANGPLNKLENVLPYVVQPAQIVPGLPTFFSTRCEQCPAGCGIVARNREGRIVKLDGNPDHPTNRGKLCSRGQAGLLEPYSPDRFAGPMKAGTATDWDTATATVVEAIKAAHSAGKKVAWLGRSRTGSAASLISQFTGALSGPLLMWEPLADTALRSAVHAAFGVSSIPAFKLEDAHTIVSFGADFLGTWINPVEHTLGYADSRDPAKGGFVSKLVCIEPRVGATSALADLLLSPIPGTEVGVALALARLVAERKVDPGKSRNGRAAHGKATKLVQSVDAATMAEQAGLELARLEQVADWLAEGRSVVLPGGPTTSADPTALATAVLLLNAVCGNIGRTVVFGPEHNVAGLATFGEVADLVAACKDGKVGVLFLDGVDPVYSLPAELGVARALAGIGLLVAFADESNDSLPKQALVLPTGSTLENWGDGEEILGRYALQQPTMLPLHDTRSMGDSLLAIAKALGLKTPETTTIELAPATPLLDGEDAPVAAPTEAEVASAVDEILAPEADETVAAPGLEAENFYAYLRTYWESVLWPQFRHRGGTFADFWIESLKTGGAFYEITPFALPFNLASLPGADVATPAGEGLVLTVFPHPFLYDGRHANKPWAQEVPEPLSTFTWGTWAEIHPDTAEARGIHRDDQVTVTTAQGSVTCGWFGSPGIRKDTVAVVLGNGHVDSGRYSRFGANPNKLVPSKADAAGTQVLVATRATVARSRGPNLYAYAGSLTMEGRGINYAAHAADLEHAKGPGSMVHPHAPPVDERLIEAGLNDFYPEPEHPTYRFAMAVDLNRCTGCGACESACYAENNLPFVGPEQIRKGRNMGWVRLSRYWEGSGEHPDVRFQPVMCQQCSHAPCEAVCPVLATYHNLDGLNAMVYNRCVGTRYCGNNCPYSARRFNYHTFGWPQSFELMLNPEVVTREMGVMEKCTFCVQRLRSAKDTARDEMRQANDGELRRLTACAQACPADAITFGNAKDAGSEVSEKFSDPRAYTMLGELNTKPGVRYLARILHTEPDALAHGGGHGGGGQGSAHGSEH